MEKDPEAPWFPRGAPELLRRLRRYGGFTVDPRTGAIPTSGFAVNTGVGALLVPGQQILGPDGTDLLDRFLRHHPDLRETGSTLFLGAWHDLPSDRVVLSGVDLLDDRDRAVELGIARHQTDVYDLAEGRLLPTGVVRRS